MYNNVKQAHPESDIYIRCEPKKEKRVGWFTRWFDRKCREAWERASPREVAPIAGIHGSVRNQIDGNGLRLTIYGADGGTVLEFNNYDIKHDRYNNTLHVIGHNENFEERVSQAITMELLRQGMTK